MANFTVLQRRRRRPAKMTVTQGTLRRAGEGDGVSATMTAGQRR
ncbi:MAG TPA: hypothetical protein VGG03_02460 [Thermoanaerobaculia bacterium]